jgi:hypothetical protein
MLCRGQLADVRKAVSSFLICWVVPKWIVHEENQMGNMGLTLSKVPAAVFPMVGNHLGLILYAHKQIIIIDLCHP